MPRPGIAVLMYHALVGPGASSPSPLHIEAGLFEHHMAWLHAQGYETLTVPELYHRLVAEVPHARPAVAITFDDGYQSLVTRAAPILQKYGFTATLFLPTDFVGMRIFGEALANTTPPADRPLTWAEVQTLHALGWDVQAHSCSHRPHAALPAAQLRAELAGSRQAIEDELKINVLFYAFPYGSYSRRALEELSSAGYQAGFSVHDGPARPGCDLRRLPRVEINAKCTPAVFAKLVRTGYASAAAKYRALLRDMLFYSPTVKDALQKALAGFIN